MQANDVATAAPPGITGAELTRQAVHAGIGLFALLLRFLTGTQAMLVALAAAFANFFLLPRTSLGRRVLREGEGPFGGTVVYPLVVAALILALPKHLAAGAWIVLAFGDGASNVCGRTLGRRKLPWNRRKSWAGTFGFALVATPCAAFGMLFVQADVSSADSLTFAMAFLLAALAATVGAFVESLPLSLDDNLTVGAAAGLVLAVSNALLIQGS